jgi:hypothetical protein
LSLLGNSVRFVLIGDFGGPRILPLLSVSSSGTAYLDVIRKDGLLMTRAANVVRLLAAVAVSLAACKLVDWYGVMSYVRLTLDHPGAVYEYVGTRNQSIIAFANAGYAYVVPFALLLAGVVIILRWPNAHALIELATSSLWFLAFVWFALTVLAWQMQNVPASFGGQTRYYLPY